MVGKESEESRLTCLDSVEPAFHTFGIQSTAVSFRAEVSGIIFTWLRGYPQPIITNVDVEAAETLWPNYKVSGSAVEYAPASANESRPVAGRLDYSPTPQQMKVAMFFFFGGGDCWNCGVMIHLFCLAYSLK
jgi:hypothetical protein